MNQRSAATWSRRRPPESKRTAAAAAKRSGGSDSVFFSSDIHATDSTASGCTAKSRPPMYAAGTPSARRSLQTRSEAAMWSARLAAW